MKIFLGTQIRDLDKYTMDHEPISSIDLMERAATAVAESIKALWDMHTPVIVFAGPGNNGGDALAVSRMLAESGYNVQVYLFNVKGHLSDDCRKNRGRLEGENNVTVTEITTQFEPPALAKGDLVVDGLFGTGLNKPLEGGYASLVRYINSSKATVASIDMPSGLMSEDNRFNVSANIVRADITFTMQQPKLSFFFAENQQYVGRLQVLDIELHPDGIASIPATITTEEPDDVCRLIHSIDPFAHKGQKGHGLLIAGQYGMAGAACLAAKAALRSGIGKVTVHTPRLNNNIVQVAVPEAILELDADEEVFTEATFTTPYGAVAIGPGLGRRAVTADAFANQLRLSQGRLILDADAINLIGNDKDIIRQLPPGTILTPHPKELENLVGPCSDSYDRLTKAGDLAIEQQLFIIIKGHYTNICTPAGHTYINPTGNAGMATAGSGDVLTGVLLALLSGGYSAEDTCRLGVYLHGLAGDIAARRLGEDGLIASDIIEALPQAFRELRDNGEK
jgi:NAD(P)H-hydrate epimerase